jgi:nifR3 family TIM-barrel protein
LRQVLRAVKTAVSIPVSIKSRTGWDDSSKNSLEVARIAHDEGIVWVSIHGRTRAQAYNGQANWEYIAQVKKDSPLPVIGNGDIHSAAGALERLRSSGCDGVMIGRGCLKNPFIFQESLRLWKSQEPAESERSSDYLEMLSGLQSELESFYDDRLVLLQMKKFSSWYSSGFPGSSQFRKQVFQLKEKAEVLNVIFEYFSNQANVPLKDTSDEPFLMGGHG